MTTAASCADSARPPGSPSSVNNLHDQLPSLIKESEVLNPPTTKTQPPESTTRRRRRQDQNPAKLNHFHWKETQHQYTPPKKKSINASESAEKPQSLVPAPDFHHPRPLLFPVIAMAIVWLREIASDLHQILEQATDYLIPRPRPPKTIKPTTRTELPMTTSLLPYMHAADIINHQEKSEGVLSKKDAIFWNTMFDPTTDQLQVYTNGRVRLYRRQRKSRRFVYLRCKTDNTFSRDSKIVLGHWQNSYFILLSVLPRPLKANPTTNLYLPIPALSKTESFWYLCNPRTLNQLLDRPLCATGKCHKEIQPATSTGKATTNLYPLIPALSTESY